jgi:hypothetical protein
VQGVQALALVLLAADRAALGFVGEVAKHEPGLDEPPVLLQRSGERQLAAGTCRRATSRLAGTVPSRSDAAQRTRSSQPSRMRARFSGCASSWAAGLLPALPSR